MAVKLVDLADSLGLKVAELRDYIDFLDLDIPKNVLEISEEKARILEQEVKKDMDVPVEEAEEVEEVVAEQEPEVVEEDIAISDESLSKVQQYEEALEEEIQREIKDEQRKMTAGKKEGKEKTKKKKVKETKVAVKEPEVEADKKDTGVQEAVLRKATGVVEIPDVISVNEFAQRAGIPVARVIGELMKNGILATINQQIDYDTAAIIA